MTELQASRTLVKSPPELWAECSDAASLARHLGRFGEIRITRLDPETSVAWEGEHARGTVRIEPAGWGTKVILTATAVARAVEQPAGGDNAVENPVVADIADKDLVVADVAVEDPVAAAVPVEEPPAALAPAVPGAAVPAPRRRHRLARLLAFLRGPEREPEIVPAQSEPVAVDPSEPEVAEPVPEPEVVEPLPEPPEVVPPRPDPAAVEPAPAPEPPPPAAPPDTEAALAAALDSLGQAHHRPYSRA